MKNLTPIQRQTLAFMRAYHAEYCRLPSSRQIARHFGWRSQTTAMGVLTALTAKGQLEKIQPAAGAVFYRFRPGH